MREIKKKTKLAVLELLNTVVFHYNEVLFLLPLFFLGFVLEFCIIFFQSIVFFVLIGIDKELCAVSPV